VALSEPIDLERSRLLLVWLQSRRAVDHALSELLAAGPAGERRVRERMELIEHLVSESSAAFADYRESVRDAGPVARRRMLRVAPDARDENDQLADPEPSAAGRSVHLPVDDHAGRDGS
jgi:hypothetical protein